MNAASRDEMMTVAAARLLHDGDVCFVGIGLPSAACNLARLTHAPNIVLIYESGTIGARPEVLPLSIGDGELAQTAACVVPLPQVFSDYLQAGRVDVGFLGAAQIDRFGNLNTTVIGPYERPRTRLPGAGGAPEIAAHAKQTFVMLKATPRSFVPALDFCHHRRMRAWSICGDLRFRRAYAGPAERGADADRAVCRCCAGAGSRGDWLAAPCGRAPRHDCRSKRTRTRHPARPQRPHARSARPTRASTTVTCAKYLGRIQS